MLCVTFAESLRVIVDHCEITECIADHSGMTACNCGSLRITTCNCRSLWICDIKLLIAATRSYCVLLKFNNSVNYGVTL